jgi:hypothetical protein
MILKNLNKKLKLQNNNNPIKEQYTATSADPKYKRQQHVVKNLVSRLLIWFPAFPPLFPYP